MTESIGELLAEARRRQGLSLKDAENAVKIRAKHLAALEENEFDAVPGAAYVIGFIKTYANYLGLDSAELIKRYRSEFNYPPSGSLGLKGAIIALGPAEESPRRQWQWLIIALAALLVIAAVAAGWWRFGAAPRHRSPAAERPRSAHKVVRRTVSKSQPVRKTVQPESFTIKAKIHSAKGAWLRVVVDGRVAYEDVLPDKAIRTWTARQTVLMRSGNATAVEVFRDGRRLGTLSERESVVERAFNLGE